MPPGQPELNVVLIADSLAFHNHEGRLRLDDPRAYPNVMARVAAERSGREVELTMHLRAGLVTPEAWRLVTKDVWLQERVLPRADVVVLAFAGGDGLAVGIPTWLKDLIPRISSPSLRKRARRLYWDWHPRLVRATGGRMRMVPAEVTRDQWPRVVDVVRFYSGGARVVAGPVTPTTGLLHAGRDPHSARLNAELAELAAERGVPYADLYEHCAARLDHLNPNDGMHWHDETNARIGELLGTLVAEQAALGKEPPLLAALAKGSEAAL